MKQLGQCALFLDFNGTLVCARDNRTVVDTDSMPILLPRVAETLIQLRSTYDASFIVTNQRLIGRGQISATEVQSRLACVNERLGSPFTDWRFCPHSRVDGCTCRKPQPGMFLDLAATYSINLAASTHVGDSWRDAAAAAAAGISTFVWADDFFGWTTGRRVAL